MTHRGQGSLEAVWWLPTILEDLGRYLSPLWASVFPSVRWVCVRIPELVLASTQKSTGD